MSGSSQLGLSETFNAQATKPERRKSVKSTLPVSIRVTAEEKAKLQQMAGTLAVSAYIRQRLFGDMAAARPKQYQEKPRQPKIDHVEIARLLGMFGQSELARSMLALSLAVQAGELEASPEVQHQIGRACDDIHEIKTALIVALNIKPQEARR
jgi:hypothetical protein